MKFNMRKVAQKWEFCDDRVTGHLQRASWWPTICRLALCEFVFSWTSVERKEIRKLCGFL